MSEVIVIDTPAFDAMISKCFAQGIAIGQRIEQSLLKERADEWVRLSKAMEITGLCKQSILSKKHNGKEYIHFKVRFKVTTKGNGMERHAYNRYDCEQIANKRKHL